MQDGGLSAISADEPVVGASEVKQLKHRVRELERLLGRKTLEVDIWTLPPVQVVRIHI